jgi:hypothetical protein
MGGYICSATVTEFLCYLASSAGSSEFLFLIVVKVVAHPGRTAFFLPGFFQFVEKII